MTSRRLRRTSLGALLWLGVWIVATHAHQDPCHRWHACPSDSQTYVTEKYFVRVDVTEEFPFLVTRISPYFDR
jgi:hypothetical protein